MDIRTDRNGEANLQPLISDALKNKPTLGKQDKKKMS
jgi:hypothetical protein